MAKKAFSSKTAESVAHAIFRHVPVNDNGRIVFTHPRTNSIFLRMDMVERVLPGYVPEDVLDRLKLPE